MKRGPRIYKKVWGVIFTCTLTRGVHLDVAMDYSTESVLHTIRRLIIVNNWTMKKKMVRCGDVIGRRR